MTTQKFVEKMIEEKGAHAALVGLVSKMRVDEVAVLLTSAAFPIPTTVAWSVLRDAINRESIA